MREMERLMFQSQRKRNLKNGCHVRCPREVKYCYVTQVQIGLGGDGSGGFRCDISRAECECGCLLGRRGRSRVEGAAVGCRNGNEAGRQPCELNQCALWLWEESGSLRRIQ